VDVLAAERLDVRRDGENIAAAVADGEGAAEFVDERLLRRREPEVVVVDLL